MNATGRGPRNIPRREKEHFERIAERFDNSFNAYRCKAGRMRVERRVALFISLCGLRDGQRVLELGAGTGEYSLRLSRVPCRLFCTDISLRMAQAGVKKAPDAVFFVSDIEELPLKEGVFDAVIGNAVLHHADARRVLAETRRVLKKGGVCVFSEPNMLNPHVFLQKNVALLRRLSGDSPDEKAFFRRQVQRVLAAEGYRDIRVSPFDFLHPCLPGPAAAAASTAGRMLERLPLIKELAGSLLITGKK